MDQGRVQPHPTDPEKSPQKWIEGGVQPQPKYIKSNLSKSFSSQLITRLNPVQLTLLL
jgi:hypothetical protein